MEDKIELTLQDMLPLIFRFLVKNKFVNAAKTLQSETKIDLMKIVG